MTRLSDSYCVVGPGPLTARQEGYKQTMHYGLEDSAKYYRARAKEALRISADEAEVPNAKAAILEAALVVILEDGVPLNVPSPPRQAGPAPHTCEFPGCGAPAGSGFGELWSCAEHAGQVEATWLAAVAERERRAAEILNKEPSTSLAGVPGYLI